MNKIAKLILPLFVLFPLVGCDEVFSEFELVGKWGMVSGAIMKTDGTAERFEEIGSGQYYETLEYKVGGTYIDVISGKTEKGTYSYNNSNQTMKYKLDTGKYYLDATITIHKATEITLFTYNEAVGAIIQYLVKI